MKLGCECAPEYSHMHILENGHNAATRFVLLDRSRFAKVIPPSVSSHHTIAVPGNYTEQPVQQLHFKLSPVPVGLTEWCSSEFAPTVKGKGHCGTAHCYIFYNILGIRLHWESLSILRSSTESIRWVSIDSAACSNNTSVATGMSSHQLWICDSF